MVGVLLPASVGAALVNMALLLAGKVPVNLNFTIGPEAMQAAIDKAGIKHIIASRAFLEQGQARRTCRAWCSSRTCVKSVGKATRRALLIAAAPAAGRRCSSAAMAGGGADAGDSHHHVLERQHRARRRA